MTKRQIIIIPGIMGSELQLNQYKIWPPNIAAYWKGINVIVEKLGETDNAQIQSVKALDRYYKELINYAKDLGDDIKVFHYDWRLNNFNHIDKLKQIINLNADEVIIIAHSMGGIIAKLFLTSNVDSKIIGKVSQLITLGTPWNGAVEAYTYLKYGFGIRFVRGIFKSIIPNYESIYQLLPNKFYVEQNKDSFGYGYLNNEDWEHICNDYYIPILKAHNLEFNNVLGEFYNAMSLELPQSIIHNEIIGYGIPTLSSIHYEELTVKGKYGNGDGTVPLYSSMSKTPHKHFIKCKHSKLPSNKEVLKILKSIIVDKKNTETINSEYNLESYENIISNRFDFRVVRVACPVNVTLFDEEGQNIYGEINDLNYRNLIGVFGDSEEKVKYIDNDVYFILDEKDKNRRLHVEAYEEGAVSISIDEYLQGELSKTAKFKSFNMDNSKSAEVILNDTLSNCAVELKNKNKDKRNIESVVIDSEKISKAQELPKTEYKFLGEGLIKISDSKYLAHGNIYLQIDNRKKETYNIMNTFYNVNNSNSMVVSNEKEILLNLVEGKNTIKVYSNDIFNNTENVVEKYIYYISNEESRIPKLKIRVTPEAYDIYVEFNENEDLEKLNLKAPTYKFNFKNNEGVLFNSIKNLDLFREFNIEVNDEFGCIVSKPYIVNEALLNNILKSKANINDYVAFLNQLGIDANKMKSYKVRSEGKVSTIRRLNNTRLADADILEFKSDNIEIIIDKMKKYKIIFSNFREYISIHEESKYLFEFSVFADKIQQYEDIDLDIILATDGKLVVDEYKEIKNIDYKVDDGKYIFTLNTNEIRNLLMMDKDIEYDVKELFILIRLKDKNNSLLRACELKIK